MCHAHFELLEITRSLSQDLYSSLPIIVRKVKGGEKMKRFRKAWSGIVITKNIGDEISAYDTPFGYCGCGGCCCGGCGGCCFFYPWICH